MPEPKTRPRRSSGNRYIAMLDSRRLAGRTKPTQAKKAPANSIKMKASSMEKVATNSANSTKTKLAEKAAANSIEAEPAEKAGIKSISISLPPEVPYCQTPTHDCSQIEFYGLIYKLPLRPSIREILMDPS
jgi:hypothetical protein